ncbi:MAG: GNAT family N-acetyltransferase [Rubrivivax sp.]|nr:GNAT family N-acetyltransferase [Rubrivivax sp.]
MFYGIWRTRRDLGLPLTLAYAAHRLLQRASGGRAAVVPYGLYAQPLGGNAAALRPEPSTVVQQIDAGHPLNELLPRPAEVIARRHQQGDQCHVAVVKGQLAGTIWIARGHYDEDEVRCRYLLTEPAISAWDYDVYVEPKYRLGRTMARLWSAVDRHLSDIGVCWSFSRISRFNTGSVSSHARLGAVEIGRATFVVLGSLQLAWWHANGQPLQWHLGGTPLVQLRPPPPRPPSATAAP